MGDMRNKYIKAVGLSLLMACCLPQEGSAAIWPFKKKKKEEKKEVLTPYQKLFKNKKTQTARGLMTVHKVEDKVYVEFPVSMLGKEMLLVSAIENTSDGGEGAPGQLSGSDVRLCDGRQLGTPATTLASGKQTDAPVLAGSVTIRRGEPAYISIGNPRGTDIRYTDLPLLFDKKD